MVNAEYSKEEELVRVRKLIQTNKEFIRLYPNDYGLKLNLYSLEAREKEILNNIYEVDLFDGDIF